nr:unnamed protein product [Callosobruchus chinensis]
MQSKNGQFD